MKRIAGIVAVLLLVAVGWWGYSNYQAQRAAQKAAEQAATAAETSTLENVIWASGKLEPETWAGLSPVQSGTVSQEDGKAGD